MKNSFTPICLAALVLSLLGGCSTSSSIVTGETRPEISPEEVRIYQRGAPKVYEEIAILESNSKNSLELTEQGKTDIAIERLKEQAAKLGANGILLRSITDGYGGSFSLGVGTGSYSGNSGASVGAGTSTNTTFKIAKGTAIFVIKAAEEVPEEAPAAAAND